MLLVVDRLSTILNICLFSAVLAAFFVSVFSIGYFLASSLSSGCFEAKEMHLIPRDVRNIIFNNVDKMLAPLPDTSIQVKFHFAKDEISRSKSRCLEYKLVCSKLLFVHRLIG